MKTEIKRNEQKTTQTFPLLVLSLETENIYLLSDETKGFCVHIGKNGNSHWTIGQRIDMPSPLYNKSFWEILPTGSQVILTQE